MWIGPVRNPSNALQSNPRACHLNTHLSNLLLVPNSSPLSQILSPRYSVLFLTPAGFTAIALGSSHRLCCLWSSVFIAVSRREQTGITPNLLSNYKSSAHVLTRNPDSPRGFKLMSAAPLSSSLNYSFQLTDYPCLRFTQMLDSAALDPHLQTSLRDSIWSKFLCSQSPKQPQYCWTARLCVFPGFSLLVELLAKIFSSLIPLTSGSPTCWTRQLLVNTSRLLLQIQSQVNFYRSQLPKQPQILPNSQTLWVFLASAFSHQAVIVQPPTLRNSADSGLLRLLSERVPPGLQCLLTTLQLPVEETETGSPPKPPGRSRPAVPPKL